MKKTFIRTYSKKEDSVYERVLKIAKKNDVKVVCMVDRILLKKDGKTVSTNTMSGAFFSLMAFNK